MDALLTAGVSFAVIHGEDAAAAGEAFSDVDLVVSGTPHDLAREMAPVLRRVGLHSILIWPYDVAHTASVFLASPDAADGLQLDLLCDPHGYGHYGIRSEVLLGGSVSGTRWPRTRGEHELLYLVRKRHWKGDRDRLAPLIDEARQLPNLRSVCSQMFSRSVGRGLLSLIEDYPHEPSRRIVPRSYWIRDAMRRLRRTNAPVGFWAEIEAGDEVTASEVAGRFGRFLPRTGTGVRPTRRLAEIKWWGTCVAPTRWRPGIFVSVADRPGIFQSDLVISGGMTVEESCRRIVSQMEYRALGQA